MKTTVTFILLGLTIGVSTASADVLELRDGAVLSGSYLGGTAGTIRFQTSSGIQVIPTSDALALTFTGESAPAVATATPAPPTAPAPAPAPVVPETIVVPAGTTLLIRTGQPISTDYVITGDRFSFRLDAALVVDGVVVAPKNTPGYGTVVSAERARRLRGRSKLEITLTELTINGELQKIATQTWNAAADPAAAAAVRGAAAGAAIGAIADGSSGAGTGAAIGATAGGLKRGNAVYVPRNHLMEFKTTAPVEMRVSK